MKGLRDEVSSDALTGPLLLISFVCGVLDATIYYNFRIFASNQTGNTLILTIILAGLHPSRSQLGLAAVSLGSFLLFGFIFARLGLRFTNNSHRQKWWLLVSAITQAFFVLIPCVLLTILRAGKEPLELEDKWDALMIGLFAAGSGVQVVMAKSSGTGIPTAMLTSPYADCLLDEHLFAPVLSKKGKNRTIRIAYIFSLLLGSFFGGVVQKHVGTIAVVWAAFGLRVVSVVWISLLQPDQGAIRLEGEGV